MASDTSKQHGIDCSGGLFGVGSAMEPTNSLACPSPTPIPSLQSLQKKPD